MAKDTHVTAPTRFVEAGGIRYAYRRFGSESGTALVLPSASHGDFNLFQSASHLRHLRALSLGGRFTQRGHIASSPT
jgi:hypothetical protein